jgi:hypothetical protein
MSEESLKIVSVLRTTRLEGVEVVGGTRLNVVPDGTGDAPVDLEAQTIWRSRAQVLRNAFGDSKGVTLSFE